MQFTTGRVTTLAARALFCLALVAGATGAGPGDGSAFGAGPAAPLGATPPVVILDNSTRTAGAGGQWLIAGEVSNTTSRWRLAPFAIDVLLADAQGNELDHGLGLSPYRQPSPGSWASYRPLAALAPGEKACFSAEIPVAPPEWSSYRLALIPLSGASGRALPAGVKVVGDAGTQMSDGQYRIQGRVRNGSRSRVSLQVIATLYNTDGKVIGCVAGKLNAATIAASQSSYFRVDFASPDQTPVRSYRLRLEADAATPLPQPVAPTPAPRPAPPVPPPPGPVVWPTPTPAVVWNPAFNSGSPSADTCGDLGSAGQGCTFYWSGTGGATGLWIRVDSWTIAECSNSGGSTDPSDALGNWRPLSGPAGSLFIKFNGAGGYKVTFRVARGGNDSAYVNEKPIKVRPCGPAPTAVPTSAPVYPTPAP